MSETLERPGTDLVVVSALNAVEVYSPGGVDALLKKLEQQALAPKFDVSTEVGRKAAKSHARKVSSSKIAILEMGASLTLTARQQIKAVNDERNRIEQFCDGLRDRILAPVREIEEAEAARVERNRLLLAEIDGLHALAAHHTPEDIEGRQTRLEELAALAWDVDFKAVASEKVAVARDTLASQHAARTKARKDAEELAAFRAQREAEEQRKAAEAAAHERAELARKAADAARVEAEQKADQARREAEAAAAERQAQAEATAQAERDRADRLAADAERIRLKGHEDAMNALRSLAIDMPLDASSARISAALEFLGTACATRDWQEFAEVAGVVIEDARESLATQLGRAREREAAIEKQRAQEAAAEQERQAKAREERAAQLERDKAEAARKADQAAAERRAANQAYRKRINRAAVDKLVLLAGLTEEQAIGVVTAIAKNEIPAVSIRY